MIERIIRWQEKNFPKATVDEPLLGMLEELGEHKGFALTEDDIADFVIFTIHFCHLQGFFKDDLFLHLFEGELANRHTEYIPELSGEHLIHEIYALLSKLAQHTLKEKQGIRPDPERKVKMKAGILECLFKLNRYITAFHASHLTLKSLVQDVFVNVVEPREWKANASKTTAKKKRANASPTKR